MLSIYASSASYPLFLTESGIASSGSLSKSPKNSPAAPPINPPIAPPIRAPTTGIGISACPITAPAAAPTALPALLATASILSSSELAAANSCAARPILNAAPANGTPFAAAFATLFATGATAFDTCFVADLETPSTFVGAFLASGIAFCADFSAVFCFGALVSFLTSFKFLSTSFLSASVSFVLERTSLRRPGMPRLPRLPFLPRFLSRSRSSSKSSKSVGSNPELSCDWTLGRLD